MFIMGRQSDAKQRLMSAVMDLIWQGSYGDLRVDDICKKAEVKKGSFYYFFPSKEELAAAAIQDYWETTGRPSLDECFSASRPPLERILAYLKQVEDFQLQVFEDHQRVLGCAVLSLACETGTNDEIVATTVREIFQRKRAYIESCIRDGMANGDFPKGNAAERASGLWALIEGSLAQARILNDLSALKQLPSIAATYLKAPSLSEVVSD